MQFKEFFKKLSRELFYSCAFLVCNRGELSLELMGFKQEPMAKNDLKMKTKICLQYQEFLYNTLETILDKTA
jgi:hypothetical protein